MRFFQPPIGYRNGRGQQPITLNVCGFLLSHLRGSPQPLVGFKRKADFVEGS